MEEQKFREVHESPYVMLIPLFILSIGALSFGYIFKSYFIGGSSDEFWNHAIELHHHEHHHIPFLIYYLPAILGVVGFIIAWYMYLKNTKLPRAIASMNEPLYQFLLNKWYFDELYNYLFVLPAKSAGKFLWKIIDEYLIDGFGPNGIASLVLKISQKAKTIQTGFIYHYAFSILIGLSFLITYFIFVI
jgi:NADH-quinone oxidoreductase subunit L